MLTGIRLGKAKMNKSTPKPRSPSASRKLPRLALDASRLAIYSRSSTEVRRLFTCGFAGPLSAREEDGSPVISCKAALVLSIHGVSPRPADHPRHLSEGKEGNERDAHDERRSQPFSNRSAADHRKGLGQAFAVPQPDENLFNEVGGEQQRGEGYRL